MALLKWEGYAVVDKAYDFVDGDGEKVEELESLNDILELIAEKKVEKIKELGLDKGEKIIPIVIKIERKKRKGRKKKC